MPTIPLVSLLLFIPFLGVIFLSFIDNRSQKASHNIRAVSLFCSFITFGISLLLWMDFNFQDTHLQFVDRLTLIPDWHIEYFVGIDGIALAFILLTTLLFPICLHISCASPSLQYMREYAMLFLLLECLTLTVFCAQNIFLFYIAFEAVLIPMTLIIGIWGGKRRIYASIKFFLYTFAGSLFMLLGFIYMAHTKQTGNLSVLTTYIFSWPEQVWLWLACFVSFAIKTPMWPVHTWLPDAHVEAPTAGSVILAGILLKMGGFGFLRFSLPLFPDASHFFAPYVHTLSVIAIIYASMVAFAQDDMKKLIAYSSIAHMGFVTLGLFSGYPEGLEGAMMQMVSHGVISAGLFLSIGVVYERFHTREIAFYKGIKAFMPQYAAVFLCLMMGSIGLPGTSGFIGEFLVLLGITRYNFFYAIFAASGMVLGAVYGLNLVRKIFHGPLPENTYNSSTSYDLTRVEKQAFIPLLLLMLGLGLYAEPLFKMVRPSLGLLSVYYRSSDSSSTGMVL